VTLSDLSTIRLVSCLCELFVEVILENMLL